MAGATITASTDQAQGDQQLVDVINEIATCAASGDAVTLPAAVSDLRCFVINHGASDCHVFCATNEYINETQNAFVVLSADDVLDCQAYASGSWAAVTIDLAAVST